LCPYDITRLALAVITCAGLAHPVLIAALFRAECDRPLRAPPGRAAVLAYRADLAAVRKFTAMHATGVGMSPHRISDRVLAVSELAANTFRYTSAGGLLSIGRRGES
jgi:hypothetical protein